MQREYKVLLIDDEPMSCYSTKAHLYEHFQVVTADSGKKGLEIATQDQPDLVLLDLNMPDLDGYEVCMSLRTNEMTRKIPVIIVTGYEELENRIKAFTVGADDFISKPFSGSELLARIRSKIRRLDELRGSTHHVVCGNLQIDSLKREVMVDSQPIEFSMMEFNLLKCLVQNQDRVMSRADILRAVWKGCAVSSRTIDSHILALRRQLENFDHDINSVYGIGYSIKPKKAMIT